MAHQCHADPRDDFEAVVRAGDTPEPSRLRNEVAGLLLAQIGEDLVMREIANLAEQEQCRADREQQIELRRLREQVAAERRRQGIAQRALHQTGGASCRERGDEYVENSDAAVTLKQKKKRQNQKKN